MKHAALITLLLTATPAWATQEREESATRCTHYAPTRTVPGYYDANKRWVAPQYIRGACDQWKTTTTRPVTPPSRKPPTNHAPDRRQ